MTTDLFIGMDISSFKVDICVLPCELSISIRDFYESDDFKKAHQILPYDISSVDYIASLKPTVVILEPTGKYGQFWIENLRSRNVPVLMVNQSMVKETRKALGGSDSKDDPYDCLVLLQCYFQHYVRQYSRLFWVHERNENITAIRRCLLDIQSIVKKQTQCINTVKQRLKVEHPAKSEINSVRINGNLHPEILPSFWAWVAEWFECRTWKIHQTAVTKYKKEYDSEMERGNGSGITPLTRQYAYQICLWHQSEAMLEMELIELISNPEFKSYLEVMNRFGLGLREKAWI